MADREYGAFAGLTIHGDYDSGHRSSKEQFPVSQLDPLLRQALASPHFGAFRWRQYTPYFNDGDPCYFSVNEVYVQLVPEGKQWSGAEDEDALENDDNYWNFDDDVREDGWKDTWTLKGPSHYDHEKRERVYDGEPLAEAKDVLPFMDAVNSGHYEDALLQLFGDHATVTITKSGIDVEFYEHE